MNCEGSVKDGAIKLKEPAAIRKCLPIEWLTVVATGEVNAQEVRSG